MAILSMPIPKAKLVFVGIDAAIFQQLGYHSLPSISTHPVFAHITPAPLQMNN
jgi:hypothetical protein